MQVMNLFRSRLTYGILGLGALLVSLLVFTSRRGYSIGSVSVSQAKAPHLRAYYHK